MTEPEECSTILVAMGGHAFLKEGERGTIEQQERNAARVAGLLMPLVEAGHRLIVTHGNGPQVGSLLLQQEAARQEVPPMPLDVLVGMTEGSLGYILQQSMLNELRTRDIRRWVVTMVTQVVVDARDPAFDEPAKPVGPVLPEEEAIHRRDTLGWDVREDPGRGWRRYVPSPTPIKVIQHRMIRDSVEAGHIVVAGGGGGIPVVQNGDGRYVGVEAVVDKDLTSSVLAAEANADILVILTPVPNVYVDFRTPRQRALEIVALEEVEALQREGHFPPGSMGPKVEAVIRFLRSGGRRALITDPESLPEAIGGRAGTHFVEGSDPVVRDEG